MHNCNHSCEHRNVEFCNDCGKVHCVDCSREWGAKEVEYVPYYPQLYIYPPVSTPTIWTDDIDWTQPYTITTTGSGNLEIN